MPRAKPLLREQQIKYLHEQESLNCEVLLLKHRIKKKEVAELLQISPTALSKQFRNKNISFDCYLAVQMLVEEREKGL